MSWYIAKIVFKITSGSGNHQAQFDEQLRLINAPESKEAFEKARAIGLSEQDSFLNTSKESVQWQFIDVAELNLLGDLKDGQELSYNIQEKENADDYIAWIHYRATLIGSKEVFA